MTKEQFWKWIDHFRESSGDDPGLFFHTAQETLLQQAPADIRAFRACLGAYMEAAGETVWLGQ